MLLEQMDQTDTRRQRPKLFMLETIEAIGLPVLWMSSLASLPHAKVGRRALARAQQCIHMGKSGTLLFTGVTVAHT